MGQKRTTLKMYSVSECARDSHKTQADGGGVPTATGQKDRTAHA
ncbi:hypothetical protein LOM8899_03390 [Flavimaricola marinus]|uniref:Uncharacterized protein n=1 Tax=Flavimaricola marinus TaxID=1819565 RepID=A0A238LIK0_9RHOB|nr:hypothetical protein LOM8899_03390 [Flavimaricola marinus]